VPPSVAVFWQLRLEALCHTGQAALSVYFAEGEPERAEGATMPWMALLLAYVIWVLFFEDVCWPRR